MTKELLVAQDRSDSYELIVGCRQVLEPGRAHEHVGKFPAGGFQNIVVVDPLQKLFDKVQHFCRSEIVGTIDVW